MPDSILALLLTLCAVCNPIEPAQVTPNGKLVGEIAGAHTAGQTFLATQDGLSAIDVLQTGLARRNQGDLVFHLRAVPDSNDDLRTVVVSAEDIADNAYQHYAFAPLPDSAGRRYFFELAAPQARPGNAVSAWRGNAQQYSEGGLYLDGQAADGQLTFKLEYQTAAMLAGVWADVLAALPSALATAALFVLPGLALILWCLPDKADADEGDDPSYDGASALTLAPGVTLALLALLLLLGRALGWRLDAGAPQALIALGSVGTVAALIVRARHGTLGRLRVPWLPGLALLIVFALTLWIRVAVVRGIDFPRGADAVQHGFIVQLLLDHGGLFNSWEPYTPFVSFTSQYGFHGAIAFFAWLTGLPTPRAVILGAQVINALSALALYPLATRLTGNRWAGVIAVLAVGLLSPTPMIYVNWSRNPQLAGQVVLPAAIWLFLEVLSAAPGWRRLWVIALAGAALAGLLLCSYRMVHFYAVLALVLWLVGLLRAGWKPWAWLGMTARAAAVALVAEALMWSWQAGLQAGELPAAFAGTLGGTARWSRILEELGVLNSTPHYYADLLLVLAGAGFVWALTRRQWSVTAVGVWVAGLASILLLRLVNFPTAAFFQGWGMMIALYMPLGILAGWALGEVVRLARLDQPRAAQPLALAAVVLAAYWGVGQRAAAVQPISSLVTTPDAAAAAWIREHVPANAVFVVNGFTQYDETSAIGSDAGWWLPLTALRANTMPPQYALTSEAEARPGYRRGVVDLILALATDPLPSAPGVAALCRAGVTHVYIGEKQGGVGLAGAGLNVVRFDGALIARSAHFAMLYHQDLVWVFALAPDACP
jgi:hypothetical protein